ncbi:SIMPL domain-containing protein [Halorubellus sp. JP-L1]|uniref:SIMPL domain-containing protein n=1 Tax=Halorubellus sp. JP-L1 TaxID=2715753 RepID=UPI00140E3A00|nr:SIMPL domain-containing protein [Halorubellus sp. JP-L1]NHN43026.1 SIMPL domain-containing protein [Halorubellus sp. JP-L1]
MRFDHRNGATVVAILLGTMVLGAGVLAGPALGADASTTGDQSPAIPSEAPTAESSSQQNESTITVSGTGSVSAQPDQAVILVATTARADSASAATAALANNSSDLRNALADAGLSNDSVRTIDFSVAPDDRQNQSAFVARQTFEVTTNDTSAVGELVDVAVENGASEVFGVQFVLSDEQLDELRETAIDRAVSDAREQATIVASSTNLRIDSVRHVRVGGTASDGRFAEAADAGGTNIDVSPVSVSVTVEVTYNATQA